MKKFFVLTIVFILALTACDSMTAPTEAPAEEPTTVPPTAEVVVVTVEVPVEVTSEAPAPTPMPTATLPPAPEPTQAPPTEAPPAEAPPTEAPAADSSSSEGPFTVASNLWSPYFRDVTYSSESFSLRCYPGEVTFSAVATDPYIVDVELYYRIEDRQSISITEWKNYGKMDVLGDGKYSLTLSGEDIHPDWRKHLAWFDFQLIGLNKGGAAVGRTEKIVKMITYTIDCQ